MGPPLSSDQLYMAFTDTILHNQSNLPEGPGASAPPTKFEPQRTLSKPISLFPS